MVRGTAGAIECGHTDRRHYAHGQCEPCYRRAQRRRDPDFRDRETRRQDRRLLSDSEKRRESLYGVTHDRYLEMLTEQNGVCAICSDPPRGKQLHVDHDHSTGEVRRLLCTRCNTALGLMRDNPDLLMDAATYLLSFRNLITTIEEM